MKLRAKLFVLGAICAALLAFSAPALAAAPAEDAYGGPGTQHQVNDGSLPFTGIDSSLVAAIGVGMLGAGFVVRRRLVSR